MFSACYVGKISPWPRPGSYADFAMPTSPKLRRLKAAMAATAEIAPVIILMSRQGGRFAQNDHAIGVVETLGETNKF